MIMRKGYKKFEVKPVEPNPYDGIFCDSYGNEVNHGTAITIEANYNYPHINNRPAVVEWDKEKGMYKYRLTDGSCFSILSDFHGISKFRVIT
jgi:hypothetical protein